MPVRSNINIMHILLELEKLKKQYLKLENICKEHVITIQKLKRNNRSTTPKQLKRTHSQMEEEDCQICAQPFDMLVRLECGCQFCNGCLKERLVNKSFCANHKKIFSSEIIQTYKTFS